MQPEWNLPLSAEGIVMELRNGGRMRVRPIRTSDAAGLIAGYDELSPQSRYYRFFTSRAQMSEAMAERLVDIDHETHFAWVVFDADTEPTRSHRTEAVQQGTGVAAARLILDDGGSSAEAALTVIDDYHHRGIGRFLIELLVSTAADVNVDVLRFEVLRDNHKMRKLMTGAGATATGVPGDATVVEFRLPVPSAATLDVPAGTLYRLLRQLADLHTDPDPTPDSSGDSGGDSGKTG